MRIAAAVLTLSLFVGCSTDTSSVVNNGNEKPQISANNSPVVEESNVDKTGKDYQGLRTLDCDDPKGFTVEESTTPGTDSLNIVRNGRVLHTIKLLTDLERNGFAFDGAKKTKDGFEMSIEYGSVIFYHKTFIFTCKRHNFYLNKIEVDSFNKHNPEKWSRK